MEPVSPADAAAWDAFRAREEASFAALDAIVPPDDGTTPGTREAAWCVLWCLVVFALVAVLARVVHV
jgi:apolipoprotein N-acyltransferase